MSGSIWVPGNPATLGLTLQASQNANVAGTQSGVYANIAGNMLFMQGKILFTAAGTTGYALNITFALNPAYSITAASVGLTIGTFVYQLGGSTTRYQGSVILGANNILYFIVNAATGVFGLTPAVIVAANDYITFSCAVPLGA